MTKTTGVQKHLAALLCVEVFVAGLQEQEMRWRGKASRPALYQLCRALCSVFFKKKKKKKKEKRFQTGFSFSS